MFYPGTEGQISLNTRTIGCARKKICTCANGLCAAQDKYNNRHSDCVRNKEQKGLKREANKEENQGNV